MCRDGRRSATPTDSSVDWRLQGGEGLLEERPQHLREDARERPKRDRDVWLGRPAHPKPLPLPHGRVQPQVRRTSGTCHGRPVEEQRYCTLKQEKHGLVGCRMAEERLLILIEHWTTWRYITAGAWLYLISLYCYSVLHSFARSVQFQHVWRPATRANVDVLSPLPNPHFCCSGRSIQFCQGRFMQISLNANERQVCSTVSVCVHSMFHDAAQWQARRPDWGGCWLVVG